MSETTLSTTKIRAGRYITNVTHRKCGGSIEIEKVGSGEFAWEAYCRKCGVCDSNGWRTLAEASREAVEFFGEKTETEPEA